MLVIRSVYEVVLEAKVKYAEEGGRIHPTNDWDDIRFDDVPLKAQFRNWPEPSQKWPIGKKVDESTKARWLEGIKALPQGVDPFSNAFNDWCAHTPKRAAVDY
ncbi:hypothetical protein FRB99_000303 [Tulasnella sp. 403]|nr:hypothetical protein FRB99_000303 [Tulasnella sp. 403]